MDDIELDSDNYKIKKVESEVVVPLDI